MSSKPEDHSGPNDGYEFELARARLRAEKAELELAKVQERTDRRRVTFQVLQYLLEGSRAALWIAATWFPIKALQPIAEDLSGTNVRIDGLEVILFILSVLLAVGWSITGAQSRLRKKKIKEQRERLDRLEVRLFQQRANPEGE